MQNSTWKQLSMFEAFHQSFQTHENNWIHWTVYRKIFLLSSQEYGKTLKQLGHTFFLLIIQHDHTCWHYANLKNQSFPCSKYYIHILHTKALTRRLHAIFRLSLKLLTSWPLTHSRICSSFLWMHFYTCMHLSKFLFLWVVRLISRSPS